MAQLEVIGLDKRFGGIRAVHDVGFSVRQGTITAIIGPNGAGKTTIFNLITGTFPPDGGNVLFEGNNITGEKPHRVAAHGIIRTFQNIKLTPHMTVLENVKLGRHIRSKAGFFQGLLHLPSSLKEERDIDKASRDVLGKLSLENEAETSVSNLSFGKQRSVELARALAAGPNMMLLDEPAAGLNMHETEALGGTIKNIRDSGITVLLVEHDMSLVMDISDFIIVLNFGEKIAEGVPRDIQNNDEVISIYLGEADA